jgi:hypothetical protein
MPFWEFWRKGEGTDKSVSDGQSDQAGEAKETGDEGEASPPDAFPTLEPDRIADSDEAQKAPAPHFLHGLNKGGLEDILANQRLKVNDGNAQIAGGAEAVNAWRSDVEKLRDRMREAPEHIREMRAKEVVIEFTTDVPPTGEHPWTRWSVPLPLETPKQGSMESGGYLPIKVLGVFDGLGNPLPSDKLPKKDGED